MSQLTELAGKLVRSTPEDLSSEAMQRWIDMPTTEVREKLRNFLIRTTDLSIFKTVEIGTHRSVEALIVDLEAEGNYITSWAKDVMFQDEFTLVAQRREIDLVVQSVSELGFKDSVTYREIIDRARELGLELVPAEVALQLRLDYTDQPEGEYLVVAHEPITDSGGRPCLLGVRRGSGGRRLDAWSGCLGRRWRSGYRFAFAARK